MASMKLLTEKINYQTHKAQIVASITGVDLEVVEKDAKEVSSRSPTGRGPVLLTPGGNVSESNAIARYLARLRPDSNLYGSTFTGSAQVDMWVDFSNNEIEPARANWLAPVNDEVDFNGAVYTEAKADVTAALTVLNNHLRHNQFLVGNGVTVADITVAVALADLYRTVFSPDYLKNFKSVTRWFENLIGRPEIGDVVGKVVFASAEKQAAKVKKAKGAKPEGKGKAKEADEDEEETDAAPKAAETKKAAPAEVKKPVSPPPEKKAEAAPAEEKKGGGKKKGGGEEKKAGGEEKKAGGNNKKAAEDKKAGGEEQKGKGSKKGEDKKAGGEEKKAAGGKKKAAGGDEKKAAAEGGEEKKAAGGKKKGGGEEKKAGGEEKKAGGDDKKAGKKKGGGGGEKKAEEKKEEKKDESKMSNDDLLAKMEEEENKPSKKPANPLDLLPKSNMSLDTVKKSFWSQKPYNPNFFEGFWKEFDAVGFSLYTISYQYDADNRIYFMTQNQLGGFIQRVDDLRKYGMGVLVLTGATDENPPWHVGGCWLFRGQDIPQEMKESGDADYYTWTKIDVTNADHRKSVEAFFTSDVVEGQTVLDRRYFK